MLHRFISTTRHATNATCQASSANIRAASRQMHSSAFTSKRSIAATPSFLSSSSSSSSISSSSSLTSSSRFFCGAIGVRHMSSGPTTRELMTEAFEKTMAALPEGQRLASVDPLVFAPPIKVVGSWFSWFHPVIFKLQDLASGIHSMLPPELAVSWIPAIVLTTLVLRGCTIPFAYLQQRNIIRTMWSRPEMKVVEAKKDELAKRYTLLGQKLPQERALEYLAERSAVTKKWGTNMGYSLLPMLSAPIFGCMFFAMRTMGYVDPSFLEGGAFWFHNLAQIDPGLSQVDLYFCKVTIGLPVINAALMAYNVRMNGEMTESTPSGMKKFMYFLALVSIPWCSTQMPAGVLVYWCCSNLYSIIQAKVLRSKLGELIGIPPRPPRDLADEAEQREKMSALWRQTPYGKAWYAMTGRGGPSPVTTQQALNPFEQAAPKPTTTTTNNTINKPSPPITTQQGIAVSNKRHKPRGERVGRD